MHSETDYKELPLGPYAVAEALDALGGLAVAALALVTGSVAGVRRRRSGSVAA